MISKETGQLTKENHKSEYAVSIMDDGRRDRKVEGTDLISDHSHFDLCQLQDHERRRKKHQKQDDRRDHCQHEINQILHETVLPTDPSNRLLSHADRSWIISHTQNRRKGRTSLQEYLRKNREMFTLQYTVNVKQSEIERLERQLREEERALARSEKHLTEDSALFDQFLDKWSRRTSDAILRADEESRKKEELTNQIKQLHKIRANHQNDQNYLTDLLKQSRRYQQFLFQFAPEEWRTNILRRLEDDPVPSDSDLNIVSDEKDSLYFFKPEQLLEIFTEMEEKSLPLVQKSQHTSEVLDQIQSTIDRTIADENKQVEQLQSQIKQLEESLKQEIEREIACQHLLIQYKSEQDEAFIPQIQKSLEILYKKYLISDDIGISPVHMLQTIEKKIKSLLSIIEQMDSSTIIEAERFRQVTVRTMEYQAKLHEENLLNQSKQQRTLLRAFAPPYQRIGRIVMERSRPLARKTKAPVKHTLVNEEEQLRRLLE